MKGNLLVKYLRQMHLAFRFRNPRLPLWCDIHPNAVVPRSTRFCHGGMGVILGQNTVLGERVVVHPQVTCGARSPHNGHPRNRIRIGDNVIIYTGASILGDVTVGHDAIIAAHCLVLDDIPPYAIVKGVPGKITGYREGDIYES